MSKHIHGASRAGNSMPLLSQPAMPLKTARAAAVTLGAAEIAECGKTLLSRVTGFDADHVSAVVKQPDGWHLTVDLIELRRIPATTDVLAAYEALLGNSGALVSYHRTRRYLRNQMMEEHEAH